MLRVCRVQVVLMSLPLALLPGAAGAQLSPELALASLQAADEFEVELFAAEPMITNPAAIDVDTHGRVWVAEIQWYRRSAQDSPGDKIKVLEDTDGDGRADKATVFAEGVFCPMSICVAGDKVYVATSPDLWVYEDKDGDLKADGPPRKLLTGFGGYNHDHGAHSLVLGPDHKWWMSHGDAGFKVAGTDGSEIEYRWGAVIRGELDGSRLETVAVNFRNPYEVCISSFGEAFVSDNDNDGNFSVRICWILEGGDYGWFGRPGPKVPPDTPFAAGWHFRASTPGFVPATLVTGFGSPTGICFYEGDAFGPGYKNSPLHTDCGPREVRVYPHEPSGAGMKASSRTLLTSSDAYFRPDDICAAPDGTLLVADWYDGGVGGHAYNNPDQGRIYRLRPKGKQPERIGQPGPYARAAEAIEGLKNPNLATQYLAREHLLAAPDEAVPALAALLEADEPNYRARALWVLDRIGGDARRQVVARLSSPEAAMRALAVRILRRHGQPYADAILALVGDSSAEVRREVLLALPKLAGPQADAALVALALGYDGQDRYLLEAINVAASGRQQQLYAALEAAGGFTADNVPLLQLLDADKAVGRLAWGVRDAARSAKARRASLDQLGGISATAALVEMLAIAGDEQLPADLRQRALEIAATNAVGLWAEAIGQQVEVADTCRRLLVQRAWQPAALKLVAAAGLKDLAPEVVALAGDVGTPLEIREQAVAVAGRLPGRGVLRSLRALLSDDRLKVRAAEALVEAQDWQSVQGLVSDKSDGRLAGKVVERLMASTGGALALLKWIDEGEVAPAAARQAVGLAVGHPDANIRVMYEKFIPEDQRPERLGNAFGAEDILSLRGNRQRGEQIFFQSSAAQCKSCHRVNGFGGALGPDLTQIGKKYERAALLETILDPSKAIAPEYVSYVLETEDGRLFAGFVVERNDREVMLKDADNRIIRVRAKDVAALEPQQKSMMPELVLRDITAQDAADLLAYLVSLKEPLAGGQ